MRQMPPPPPPPRPAAPPRPPPPPRPPAAPRGPARRPGPDACPGAVAVHRAADGGLARIRLPGGLLRRDQLDALRAIAGDLSDGYLELTSRANVQLRALAPGVEAELAARLHAAGL